MVGLVLFLGNVLGMVDNWPIWMVDLATVVAADWRADLANRSLYPEGYGNMLSISEFCTKHGACQEGRRWALDNCRDMNEVWLTVKPVWLIWIATRKGVLTDRELRLFACWSVRQVWYRLVDGRSRAAVVVAERYAAGEVAEEDLCVACNHACDAAVRLSCSYSDQETILAALAAARVASAERRLFLSAASDAAWASEYRQEAWQLQAEWLGNNTVPQFS